MINAGAVVLALMAHEEGQGPFSGAVFTDDGMIEAAFLLREALFVLQLPESGSVAGNEDHTGDHDGALRRVLLG